MKKCGHKIVNEDCADCMLPFYKNEFEHHCKTLAEIKAIAGDLYADRGEDSKTASACNRIMALTGV